MDSRMKKEQERGADGRNKSQNRVTVLVHKGYSLNLRSVMRQIDDMIFNQLIVTLKLFEVLIYMLIKSPIPLHFYD